MTVYVNGVSTLKTVEYPNEVKLKGADGKNYSIIIDVTGKLVTKQKLIS